MLASTGLAAVPSEKHMLRAVAQPEIDSSIQDFLRSDKVSDINFDSKLIARRFARYQALPLAWFSFADDAYCIRLLHVHSFSSAPNDRGVVIELRGYKGLSAMLLVKVEQVGDKWTSKTIAAEVPEKLLAVIHKADLFAMSVKDKPTYLGPYGFTLELRHGENYNLIYRDAPAERTSVRGLGGFLAVIKALIEIAEVAETEVFYGPSNTKQSETGKQGQAGRGHEVNRE